MYFQDSKTQKTLQELCGYTQCHCSKRYLAIIKTKIITSCLKAIQGTQYHTLFERRYDALLLLAPQEYIIAERELKMLEQENLFILENAVLYE